jgi:hypothetical protein
MELTPLQRGVGKEERGQYDSVGGGGYSSIPDPGEPLGLRRLPVIYR